MERKARKQMNPQSECSQMLQTWLVVTIIIHAVYFLYD